MRIVLTAASFLLVLAIAGCPGPNNPSGPAGPTSTSTTSPTLVSTATSTSTNTPTGTSTSTSTLVSTVTPTNTLTSSPTATLTSTASPTSTVTLSPTPNVTISYIYIFTGNPSISSEPGKRLNPPLYAQIWHAGSTDVTSCPAPGMQIQAGYGTVGTDPSTWSVWIPMACNNDVGNDDLYALQFTSPAQGTYNYAIRGRLNGGPWGYGDWDGTNPNDGYDEPVTLTVGAPPCRAS